MCVVGGVVFIAWQPLLVYGDSEVTHVVDGGGGKVVRFEGYRSYRSLRYVVWEVHFVCDVVDLSFCGVFNVGVIVV